MSSVEPAANSRAFRRDSLLWRANRAAIGLIAHGLFDFRIDAEGLERLPVGEPLIVAVGPHRSWFDPFLVLRALPPAPRVYFVGSREAVFNTPFKRMVVQSFGGVVPVSSAGSMNRDALTTALDVLANDASLGIFPEGTGVMREPPDRLARPRRGVGWLAARSGKRVLPVAIAGTQELWRGKLLRVRVGRPLAVDRGLDKRAQEESLAAAVAEELNRLIPPQPPVVPISQRWWPWLTSLLD